MMQGVSVANRRRPAVWWWAPRRSSVSPRPRMAATPLEVVKGTNDTVLSIYHKHRVVDAAVEKEVFAVIDPVTDYEALAGAGRSTPCARS